MELLGASLEGLKIQLNLKSNERNMSKNNQTTSKKARIKPKNQQTKEESLQTRKRAEIFARLTQKAKEKGLRARKRAEIFAGFAQIALVLIAVILSFLFGYHLRGQECKSKLRADLSRFDKIGEILLNKKEVDYVAPDFK